MVDAGWTAFSKDEVTGRRMVDAGWTAFSKDEEDDRQEEESLPPVEQGDAVNCRKVEA